MLDRHRLWCSSLVCAAALLVGACQSLPVDTDSPAQSHTAWLDSVIGYATQFSADHPDQVANVLEIGEDLRQQVRDNFADLSRSQALDALVYWITDEQGLNLRYDADTNFRPRDVHQQQASNCLGLTLLISELARELNIDLRYNAVDLPDSWGLDESVGMIFYRHVNGVARIFDKRKVVDLTSNIQGFVEQYPQKMITRAQAVGMYHNNTAIDYLREDQQDKALHHIKFAISLYPRNADFWVNLGVLKKRNKELQLAEAAFLHAMSLNRFNLPAISNLERFYRETNRPESAKKLARLANRARKSNPYYHYQLAVSAYSNEQFDKALKSSKQAIKLHDKDPRFHELQGNIFQQLDMIENALLALGRAYQMSSRAQQQQKYADKLARLGKQLEQQNQQSSSPQLEYEQLVEELQRRVY